MAKTSNKTSRKNPGKEEAFNGTMTLEGVEYPFVMTHTGVDVARRLLVNMKLVNNNNPREMMKYAYCLTAGAAREAGIDFTYNIDRFTTHTPNNWRQLLKMAMEAGISTKTVTETNNEEL